MQLPCYFQSHYIFICVSQDYTNINLYLLLRALKVLTCSAKDFASPLLTVEKALFYHIKNMTELMNISNQT